MVPPAGVRTMLRLSCFAVLIYVVFAACLVGADDWPKYLRDLSNSAHSAETGIDSSNVATLKTKWTFVTGGEVSASPAVATVNGTSTLFLGSYNGSFYAIDAVTGTKIWSFKIDIINPCNKKRCRIGSSASVDVANN